MKTFLYIIPIFLCSLFGCSCPENVKSTTTDGKNNGGILVIDKKEALKIAHEDASKIYRDLTVYKITATLKEGNWHVDYDLRDASMVGGGPHYTISGTTGKIISFRYEQ